MIIDKFGHKIEFRMTGGSNPPDSKGGMEVSAMTLWMRVDDSRWHNVIFPQNSCVKFVESSDTEYQLGHVLAMLTQKSIYLDGPIFRIVENEQTVEGIDS